MNATPLPKAEATTAPSDSAAPDSAFPDAAPNLQIPDRRPGRSRKCRHSLCRTGWKKARPSQPIRRLVGCKRSRPGSGSRRRRRLRDTLEDALLAEAKTASVFTEQERGMLLRILRFGGLRVEDVRVPRVDIIAIDEQEPLSALLQLFAKSEVSRIPVYRDTLDDPARHDPHQGSDELAGPARRRDAGSPRGRAAARSTALANSTAAIPAATRLADVDVTLPIANARINRPVLYVPPSMPAVNLLLRMQSTHIHLAIVVDEHGGTDGLVSIEDLVEQIVGEIEDEHDDDDDRNIVTDPRHGLVAAGRTPIKDLEAHLGVNIADEEATEEVDVAGRSDLCSDRTHSRARRTHSPSLRDRVRSAGCRHAAREASEDPRAQGALMASVTCAMRPSQAGAAPACVDIARCHGERPIRFLAAAAAVGGLRVRGAIDSRPCRRCSPGRSCS